ncbi:ABC transporter permease [Puia sp.]|uniref:ABC transporter permease n=1 Tax=Puia sp. TaxID=2045100 RepID=UPI002F42C819
MLKNYFKVAFRNLTRNKVFSIINIFGLSIGLTTCLLILLYIVSESGYDRQNKDANLIYRVAAAGGTAGATVNKGWAGTPAPVSATLKAELPEIAQTTRLLKFPMADKFLLTVKTGKEQKQFYEPNGYYVDSTFFQVFTYDFRYGNANSLDQPNTIVLSATLSKKLFGDENPVGRPITLGLPFGNNDYTITGVFRDEDLKSHIPAHFFLSMRNNDIGKWVVSQTNWATTSIFHTYIRLKTAPDPDAFTKKLNADIDRHAGADLKAFGIQRRFFLQPLTSIYLHSNLDYEVASVGNATTLYILGSIAAFVLIIACINFMNLSTARSAKRAKEVGVRKVLGAERHSLVYQFLGESILMSGFALLLASTLTRLLLPAFGDLVQKQLHLFDEPLVWVSIGALTLITGIVSGLYPAFYLSAFRPITVLKGRVLNTFSAVAIRKGLIVFQFTISIGLVSGAIIIVRQLNYLNSRSLGFKKDQQLILPLQNQQMADNFVALKNELGKIPAIRSVTGGSSYPGIANINDLLFYGEGKTVHDVVDISLIAADDGYCRTLGLTLLHGREFTKGSTADSNSIILNETALKQLGYDPNTAVGRKISYDFQGKHAVMQIVGVVKDFNFESLYKPIYSLGLTTTLGNPHSYLIANLNTGAYASILREAEAAWKRVNPNQPFAYSFLDKDFQANYEKDQRSSSIVGYFTLVTILIACLGLFGLSVFSAEQRTREIGIRKVLGATVTNITLLLSRDFLGLVCIAILVSTPMAWYAMHRWLQSFAYQIDIGWWLFPLSGLIAVAIAWLTVSLQAIKAAISNPVKSLRSE